MLSDIIIFQDYLIYSPNLFLLFILFKGFIFVLLIILFLKNFYRITKLLLLILFKIVESLENIWKVGYLKKVLKYIEKNSTFVLIIILLIILFSRYLVTYSGLYSNDPFIIISPAKILNLPLGVDFNSCIFQRSVQMLKGEFMDFPLSTYGVSSACGQIFPILISPFISFLKIYDYSILYFPFLIINFIGYILFLILATKNKNNETRINLFIFYISFLIGIPGVMGFTTGNVDIFLPFLLGLMLFFIFSQVSDKHKSSFSKFVNSTLLVLISAFAANAKIFLLPFALISVFFSRNYLFNLFFFLITFFSLIYIPNIFGSYSSVNSFVETILQWNQKVSLNSLLQNNHSLPAALTLFNNCVYNQNCDIKLSSSQLIFTISAFFLLLLPSKFYKQIIDHKKTRVFLLIKITKIFNLLNWVVRNKENKNLILFIFILIDAFINLIPKIVYDYRLYYSLPIIFILYGLTENNRKARFSCYLSMIFLIIYGIWITNKVESSSFNLLDARLMIIFIILHFYFLIKSGIENLNIKSTKSRFV